MMRLSILVAFTWSIVTFCIPVSAQENYGQLEYFSVNNGLPAQTIYNLLQDKNGFLWIGTDAGVSRFDGKIFVNYSTEDGLGDNEVINLFEDKAGRVWFIPFSEKLSYYYKGKFYNANNNELLNQIPERSLIYYFREDYQGNIYSVVRDDSTRVLKIDSSGGMHIYDLKNTIGTNDAIAYLHPSSDLKTVYCITQKNKLITLPGKPGGSVKVINFLQGIRPVNWYHNIDVDGYTGFCSSEGIYLLKDTTVQLILPISKLPFRDLDFSLFVDRYRNLWLSHLDNSTYFFKYNNGTYSNYVQLLKKFSIVAFDKDDNVWFCTGTGLYKTSYTKLQSHSLFILNHELLQKNVLSMFNDKEGGLWMGYSNGYVSQMADTAVIHYNINLGHRNYNRVLQIQADNDGDMWCIADEACILLKKEGYRKFSKKPREMWFNGSPKSISLDKNGKLLLTTSVGNFFIDKKAWKIEKVYTTGTYERKYSSFFTARNDCYISSVNGVKVVENNKETNLANTDPRLKVRVQQFAQNSEGIIFLATYSDGLIALKNKKVIATINHKQGMGGVICRKVCVRNDTLYVATNGGLTILAFSGNQFKILQNLTPAEGLPSSDVNDIVFRGNSVYLATSEGISAFELPIAAPKQVLPPILNLVGFRVNETAFSFNSPIIFPYRHQKIQLQYIAPVMDKPGMVQYRYRFTNGNNAWNTTLLSQLEFNDLPYGDYTIEIQAKKYNSDWSQPKTIFFTITPPFYSSWWFRLLILIAAAFILYYVAKIMLNRRYRKQLHELKQKETIEKERNRIAADIHDDIGAELTNIVLLSRILKTNIPPENSATEIAGKLEQSSDEVINKMNEVIWALNPSNDTLHKLVAHLRNYTGKVLARHGIEADIHIADEVYTKRLVKAETNRNVFLLVKETLHNAVKHSGATRINFSAELPNPGKLVIRFTDNGKGFDTTKTYTGNGLINMKKRAQAIRANIAITSAPGGGTEITMGIPL